MIFIPREYGISNDRKTKDNKIIIGRTSMVNVNNASNISVIINLPSLIYKNFTSLIILNGAMSKIFIYLRNVPKNSF